MKSYMAKKECIVSEILQNYHYTCWVKLTHKRIDEIPNVIQTLYYRFGTLAEFPATSQKEEKQQLAELKKIRKKLKKYYKKGIRDYEVFNTVSKIRHG